MALGERGSILLIPFILSINYAPEAQQAAGR